MNDIDIIEKTLREVMAEVKIANRVCRKGDYLWVEYIDNKGYKPAAEAVFLTLKDSYGCVVKKDEAPQCVAGQVFKCINLIKNKVNKESFKNISIFKVDKFEEVSDAPSPAPSKDDEFKGIQDFMNKLPLNLKNAVRNRLLKELHHTEAYREALTRTYNALRKENKGEYNTDESLQLSEEEFPVQVQLQKQSPLLIDDEMREIAKKAFEAYGTSAFDKISKEPQIASLPYKDRAHLNHLIEEEIRVASAKESREESEREKLENDTIKQKRS